MKEKSKSISCEKVIVVSCGAFHTLFLTTEGKIFSFGQNKYGRLGFT
jgi:alpha-tubulin suppressor-like RCC1 family protein